MQRVARRGVSRSVSRKQRARKGTARESAAELTIERPAAGEACASPRLAVAGTCASAPGDPAVQRVALLLDGRAVAVARCRAGRWAAQVPIKALAEGKHRLGARLEGTRAPVEVELVVDRTPPVVVSTLPSDGMVLEATALRSILVLGSDAHSGLDLARSHAELDGRRLGEPVQHAKGLSFPLARPLGAGVRRLTAELVDRAGNRTKYATRFEIVRVPAEVAAQRQADGERRLKLVKQRLKEDREFQRKVLRDPRAALIGEGLPYLQGFDGMIPPPLPDEHVEFFLARDGAEARRRLASLRKRIAAALRARGPERLRRAFRMKAARTGAASDRFDGASVRASISRMLQDPRGALRELGVAVRASEAAYLPPPFARAHADAFADWVVNVAEGAPSADATALRRPARTARRAAVLQPAPRKGLERAPAATSAKATASGAAARTARSASASRLLALSTAPVPCDLVTGVALDVLSRTYGRTVAPAFPQNLIAGALPFGLPAPFDTVTLSILLQQPGALEEDGADQLAATSPSQATVVGSDGTSADFAVTIRLHYALRVDGGTLFLDPAGLDVAAADVGPPVPGLKDAVASAVSVEIAGAFPSSAIPLCAAGAHLVVPSGQVEVQFERLFIADDQDPFGSGELYFELEAGGRRILLGQIDAEGGTTVELGPFELFVETGGGGVLPPPEPDRIATVLAPGQADFTVSARGTDRDDGGFPDADDYLGATSLVHRAQDAWSPGRHTLTATLEVVEHSLLYTIISWATEWVCWLVEAIVWIANECGEIFGFDVHWESECREIRSAIFGFVDHQVVTHPLSFVVDYRVGLVSPTAVSSTVRGVAVGNGMVYVLTDHDVEGTPDLARKTARLDFAAPGGMALALSENLVAKLARAYVSRGNTARNVSTSLDALERYSSIHLGLPQLTFESAGSPSRYEVQLAASARGSAGTNVGMIHESVAIHDTGRLRARLAREGNVLRVYPSSSGPDPVTALVASWFEPLGSMLAPRFQAADASTELVLGADPELTATEIVVRASVVEGALGSGLIFPKPTIPGRFDALPDLLLVGNASPHSLELHRRDCTYARRIHDRNLRLVFGTPSQLDSLYSRGVVPAAVLEGLQAEGYDGCYYCLRGLHWK